MFPCSFTSVSTYGCTFNRFKFIPRSDKKLITTWIKLDKSIE